MKKLKSLPKWARAQKRPHLIGAGIFMLAFALIGVMMLIRSFAAGETVYLSPETGSVQTGNDVTFALRLDAGTGVNGVDIAINYDASKLQFKSIDGSASAFSMDLIATGGNGTVNIVRAIPNVLVTGDVEIAKITFTALGGTATTANLTLSGEVSDGDVTGPPAFTNASVDITVPPVETDSADFTIETTNATPIVGSQFGLRVYVDSDAIYEGGQVTVNLPAGLSYTGTLDNAGTAFNPATTVTGTGPQTVNLVFVTQSTTLTGKQLITTIPVEATSAGAKSVTLTGARLVDLSDADITPVNADAFDITVGAASLPAPVVTRPGKAQLDATENITDLRQSFTITNFDSAATYTVTLGGQSLSLTAGSFGIPESMRNGDLILQVAASKDGASGSSTYTIRLRSPNVNRVECVELLDLLAVNGGYGGSSAELDLNFDGSVSLIDLLTITANWGGACL